MKQCSVCQKEVNYRNKTGFCRKCLKPRWSELICTEERNKKCSFSKVGNKNPMWQGNKVGYIALHEWVKSRFPKTKLCECCKKVPPYDLANRGTYDRNLENWEWLCRRCHMTKDGRIKLLNSPEMEVKRHDSPRINSWSKEELDLLRIPISAPEMVKLIPNRTLNAIRRKRGLINIEERKNGL